MFQSQPKLYGQFANWWPFVSPIQEYRTEAELIYDLLAYGLSHCEGPWSVLELGCGSGHMLSHLKNYCRCNGLDNAENMLSICKANNPEIETYLSDMTHFKITDQSSFDAILSYDAVDYLTDIQQITSTIQACRKHLKKAGLLLLAPTYTLETFRPAESGKYTVNLPEHGLSQINTSVDQCPEKSQHIRLTITIDLPDGEQFVDHHTCGLFSRDDWRIAIENNDMYPVDMGAFFNESDFSESDMPFQVFLATV